MKIKILVSAITLTFAAGAVQAAQHPHIQRVTNLAPMSHGGDVPSGGPSVLYDQMSTPTTNGVVVDDSASSSDSYDSEAADDFVVPASGWSIEQVKVIGSASGGVAAWTATSNVYIYPNAGGTPGAAATCSAPGAATAYNTGTNVVTITLATPCILSAGTYWVGVQAVNDYGVTGVQHYMRTSAPVANSAAVWRNPGDGFVTGCTLFTVLTGCGFGDPDLAFQIIGTPSTPVSLQSFDID